MPPTCADITAIQAAVKPRKKRERTASAYGQLDSRSSRPAAAASRACGAAAGHGRSTSAVTGTMPMNQTAPSHGEAPATPRRAISAAEAGVSRIPPTDSPVVATASAIERRSANQRVTRVMAGTSEASPWPIPNTA